MPIPSSPVPLWEGPAPLAKGAGPEDRPTLTLFLPPGSGPHPAIVVCPGGGYGGRADHEGEPIARWLASLGVAGLVVAYRVSPYRHPVPLTDAQRAIRLARARAGEWRLDPRRLGILGFSAGGHLAASAATMFDAGVSDHIDPVERQSSRPDAVVLCYPVITFGEYRNDGTMNNLFGENPTIDQRRAFSLETRVTADTPPTFIWHTSDDGCVPVENALLFAQALGRQHVPFALHVYPNGPHGLGLAGDHPHVAQWTTACADWLNEIGWRR
jgi:acetyl esterase/lipase